jgi:peptidyl-prolyl cis-trans isomerase C
VRRLFLLLFILALTAACGPTIPVVEPTPFATPMPTPTLPVNDAGVTLVARVNGTEITLPQFDRSLLRQQQMTNTTDPVSLQVQVLTNLIQDLLIEQAADEMGVVVTDSEVDAEVQAIIDFAGGEAGYQQWLSENLYTEQEFRDDQRSNLITSRMLELVTHDVYAGSVPQVHARHILVRTQDEANNILARMQAGEDFVALASLSLDTSTRDSGGDLGWFTHGQLSPQAQSLENVAFTLQEGQIAGPIATGLGYHVIQVLEIGEGPVSPENQPDIAQRIFDGWLQELWANATIEQFM